MDKYDLYGKFPKIPDFGENERYFKMAMKIDPSDPIILARNENGNENSIFVHVFLKILVKICNVLAPKAIQSTLRRKKLRIY